MNPNTSSNTSTLAPVPHARDAEPQPLPIPLRNRRDPAQLDALWAMTKQQRIDAMWAGRLTMFQLTQWSGQRPSEVPRLGREFAYHVMRTPEWADEAEAPRTTSSTYPTAGGPTVQPHEPLPVEIMLEHLRSHDQEFQRWLDELRDADPTFAHASALQRADWGEWQAAVHLLTGCWQAWTALGLDVVTTGSIAPVIDELQPRRRRWSSGEQAVLRWTAHFWDTGLTEVGFPHALDEQHFYRWITACHLYKHTTPLGYSHRGAR